jgi:hypothetical protein
MRLGESFDFWLGCAFRLGVCIGLSDYRYPNSINGFVNYTSVFSLENRVQFFESNSGLIISR